jgi:hypothetical protein
MALVMLFIHQTVMAETTLFPMVAKRFKPLGATHER